MTTQERKEKISKVENELDKVYRKMATLVIQRDNLKLRLERLEATLPRDPKIPTTEEKLQQSLQDKERQANLIKEKLIEGGLSQEKADLVSRISLG